MRRILAVSMVMMAVLAACSKGGGDTVEGDKGTCGPTPTAAGQVPNLPSGFAVPEGVTITSVSKAGPSTIVEGSFEGDLDAAFEAFKDGFENAGFDVTKSEQEEDDAEVNFSGANTTGQVKLSVPCEGRVGVSITIRPA
jgi:hypothetical protein